METVISRLLALSPQPDALAPIRQSLEGQPLTLGTMLTVGPIVEQYRDTLERQQWQCQEVSRRCQHLPPISPPLIPLGF